MRSDNRNRMNTAVRLDHMRQGTEEILIRKRLYQSLLILVRNQIAAVCVSTDFQHVLDIKPVSLPDGIPEGPLVRLGSDAGLLIRLILCSRLTCKRR